MAEDLTSERISLDGDPWALYELSLEQGWGVIGHEALNDQHVEGLSELGQLVPADVPAVEVG